MTYESLPPWFRSIAETVCTPAELEVVKLKAHPWMKWTRMTEITGLPPSTLRSRFDSASRKITGHPDFNPDHTHQESSS